MYLMGSPSCYYFLETLILVCTNLAGNKNTCIWLVDAVNDKCANYYRKKGMWQCNITSLYTTPKLSKHNFIMTDLAN